LPVTDAIGPEQCGYRQDFQAMHRPFVALLSGGSRREMASHSRKGERRRVAGDCRDTAAHAGSKRSSNR
jgi:hypothetical protein